MSACAPDAQGAEIRVGASALMADPAGVLYWPDEGLLAVADLHLEKGSAYAARGILLPPYDTAATLARLARLIMRYAPRVVVALGDSFHDGGGPARIAADDRESLTVLQRGREWFWIAGNHDPAPPAGVGGHFTQILCLRDLTFRHEPQQDPAENEIAGHLHPIACIVQRSRAVSRRCFAADAKRIVMPAFGAYTGGLNVRHQAFAGLFKGRRFTAHMLGEQRLYAVPGSRCLPD